MIEFVLAREKGYPDDPIIVPKCVRERVDEWDYNVLLITKRGVSRLGMFYNVLGIPTERDPIIRER